MKGTESSLRSRLLVGVHQLKSFRYKNKNAQKTHFSRENYVTFISHSNPVPEKTPHVLIRYGESNILWGHSLCCFCQPSSLHTQGAPYIDPRATLPFPSILGGSLQPPTLSLMPGALCVPILPQPVSATHILLFSLFQGVSICKPHGRMGKSKMRGSIKDSL